MDVTEILVALIAAASGVGGTLLTNWSKIFPPKDTQQVKVAGYSPTDDYEIELRYYLNITGARDSIAAMNDLNVEKVLRPIIEERFADHPELVERAIEIIRRELHIFDSFIPKAAKIYEKYIPLETIQELNRFHSTDVMQQMRKKQPHIFDETAAVAMSLVEANMARVPALIDHQVQLLEAEARP